MVFTLDQAIDLRKNLSEKYDLYLHMHDVCGAQSFYFTFDNPVGEDIQKYISEYIAKLGGTVNFSNKYDGFSIQ